MISNNQPRTPFDYVDAARVPLSLDAFTKSFRKYPWAREVQKCIRDDQIERLFEITCEFLREKSGIVPMRESGVLADIEKCQKLIIAVNRKLEGIEALLRKSIPRGGHWTAKLTRPILNDVALLRNNVEEVLSGDELHRLSGQRSWASKLSLKEMNYDFTHKLERFVTKLRLPEKKQKQNTNAFIAAVFIAAREMRASGIKQTDIGRVRRMRYNARISRSKPL